MAKKTAPNPTPEKPSVPEPAVDDRKRRAFLDELEGKVPVAEAASPVGKRKIKVKAEEPPVAPASPATDEDFTAVLPDATATSKKTAGTFDQAKRQSRWPWIIVGVVALAVVAVAGYFFFSRGTKFSGTNLGLVLKAPDQVASGDVLTLTVQYHNEETVDLTKAEISLVYPDGFTVTSVSKPAMNDQQNTFSVGTIRSTQVGEFTVTGRMVGTVGSTVDFTGTMTYRPSKYNSDFSTTAKTSVNIFSSSVALTIDGPKKLSPQAAGTWTIQYENTSERDADGLQVDVTFPDGLTVTSTDPKPTADTNIWRLPTLKAGAKGSIKIVAKATGTAGDTIQMTAALSLIQPGNVTEKQTETTFLTSLVATGATVSIAANGVTDASAIKPGDTLTYTIQIANQFDTELNDVQVAATFTGAIFDLTNRQDASKGTLKDKTITWTKVQVPGLAQITTKGTLTITLSLPTVVPTPAKSDTDRNPQGSISVAITSPDLPTTSQTPTVLVTKVQTTMAVAADARYYDDADQALGTGPIPPKVGQTTAYRINWSATSTTNDLNTFSMSAVLPTNVLWTGRHVGRDAGDINFDPASRTVTWTINKVPGGTGSRYPILTATFEVSVTPTADQVGSDMVLTEAAAAMATDASTNQKMTATSSSLTTAVPQDPQAAGQGKVVP